MRWKSRFAKQNMILFLIVINVIIGHIWAQKILYYIKISILNNSIWHNMTWYDETILIKKKICLAQKKPLILQNFNTLHLSIYCTTSSCLMLPVAKPCRGWFAGNKYSSLWRGNRGHHLSCPKFLDCIELPLSACNEYLQELNWIVIISGSSPRSNFSSSAIQPGSLGPRPEQPRAPTVGCWTLVKVTPRRTIQYFSELFKITPKHTSNPPESKVYQYRFYEMFVGQFWFHSDNIPFHDHFFSSTSFFLAFDHYKIFYFDQRLSKQVLQRNQRCKKRRAWLSLCSNFLSCLQFFVCAVCMQATKLAQVQWLLYN